MIAADIVTVLAAVGTLIVTTGGVVVLIIKQIQQGHVLDKVEREVTTLNGQTMAELMDAIETRRIKNIPEIVRTDMEEEHIEILGDVQS